MANALRLLKLPGRVREQVATGQLAMGHARALLGLEDARVIEDQAEQVIKKELSVRQTEDLVRRAQKSEGKDKPQKDAPPQQPLAGVGQHDAAPRPRQQVHPQVGLKQPDLPRQRRLRDVEERLQRALGARVTLRQKTPQSGIIEVHYHSLDQLDGLLLRLCGEDE